MEAVARFELRALSFVPSLVVNWEAQEQIDYFWEKLSADGGKHIRCGGLKDEFGMPWQITPCPRVTSAVWQMEKLDLAELEQAANESQATASEMIGPTDPIWRFSTG